MAAPFIYRSDERASASASQQTPGPARPSTAARTMVRLAQCGALVSALATICRLALWGDNSPVSPLLVGLSSVALLPVALALHQLLRTRLSEIMLAVGAASLLR